MEDFSFILLFTAQIENFIAIVVVVVGLTYQIADLTQLGNRSDLSITSALQCHLAVSICSRVAIHRKSLLSSSLFSTKYDFSKSSASIVSREIWKLILRTAALVV